MKHIPRRFRTHYYRDRAEGKQHAIRVAAMFEKLMNPPIWVDLDD